MMNVVFLWDGTDMRRYLAFRREHPDEFRALMQRGPEIRMLDPPHAMPCNDMALFMGPRLSGYSCTDFQDLTAVEVESRQRMMMLDISRRHMPGFDNVRIMQTAPQMACVTAVG
jgi:hypothetical protein